MMFTHFLTYLQTNVLPILLIFMVGIFFAYASRRIAHWILSIGKYSPRHRLPDQRRATLEGVFAGLIVLISFTVSAFFCVAQFVELDTLIWVVGLFSAAFGLGFRPLISDFMTGLFFVIENTLDIGEKVEIMGFEGVVEEVNLRVIHVRGMSGELIVIPNGEIRQFRNYSRGEYTPITITIQIMSKDLQKTLPLLEDLGMEAMTLLPNLIEQWQVISGDHIGQHIELKVIAKSKFGQGAQMRPRMQALIQERLTQAEVELAG
ncbi:MAG: mechanosensitive ion channel family protein [Anaerolineae bacterium]